MKTLLLLVMGTFFTVGCGTAYTSIRQEPDGNYVVSGLHSGFFTMSGKVYRCEPQGNQLKCTETGEN